jgi:hypothetical protein
MISQVPFAGHRSSLIGVAKIEPWLHGCIDRQLRASGIGPLISAESMCATIRTHVRMFPKHVSGEDRLVIGDEARCVWGPWRLIGGVDSVRRLENFEDMAARGGDETRG